MGLFGKLFSRGETKSNAPSKSTVPQITPEMREINARIEKILPHARAGNPKAQYDLSKLYGKANWIDNNSELAETYFQQALSNNSGDALWSEIFKSIIGFGRRMDSDEEEQMTLKAAENGSLAAQQSLAQTYEKSINENLPAAAYWYERAAEGGHADSAYTIGKWYAEGKGVARDFLIANYWLDYAARLGNEEAGAYLRNIADFVEHAKRIREEQFIGLVRQYLDSLKWNYDYDEEDQIIDFGVRISCKLESCRVFIIFFSDSICASARCPLTVSKENEANVVEYITRANYCLVQGSFTYDYETKKIDYESHLNCRKGLPSIDDIKFCIDRTYLAMQQYGDGLFNVINGIGNIVEDIEKADKN